MDRRDGLYLLQDGGVRRSLDTNSSAGSEGSSEDNILHLLNIDPGLSQRVEDSRQDSHLVGMSDHEHMSGGTGGGEIDAVGNGPRLMVGVDDSEDLVAHRT